MFATSGWDLELRAVGFAALAPGAEVFVGREGKADC